MTTNKSNLKQDVLVVIAGLICLVAAISLSSRLETKRNNLGYVNEPEELSLQGENLKGYALGFEGLIADWYWMRSLQYIGEKLIKAKDNELNIDNLKPLDPKLLYPLLDNATTLDPQFMAVYSYGANVLPAIDKQQAIAIAKKGIENNPEQWILYHQLGFIYWKLRDYPNASKTYEAGSNIKGAPSWMTSMAGRMNREGGSRETAREIYLRMYRNAGDSQTKESAEFRLKELDSLDERDLLNETLEEFKTRNRRCAKTWSEVLQILKTKNLKNGREFRIDRDSNVVDPTDAPYLIDSKTCKVRLHSVKSGLPRS